MSDIISHEIEQLRASLVDYQQKLYYLEGKMTEVIIELENQLEKISVIHFDYIRPKLLARCYYQIRQSALLSRLYRFLKTLPGVKFILSWSIGHIKQKM